MGGASRQAVKKYVETTFNKVVSPVALRNAIKKLVDSGVLLQDGQRFKLDKDKRVELRKPAPKPKKKKKPKKKTTKKKKEEDCKKEKDNKEKEDNKEEENNKEENNKEESKEDH